MSAKILITGINGFIGSNLVRAWKDTYALFGLDILPSQQEGVKGQFDWSELDDIPDLDVVVHLAGKAHDTRNSFSPQAYYDINTGLTRTIFDWFLATPAKTFIFFSSVKAVADSVPGEVLTEEDQPDPRTDYGKSKLEAERYILGRLRDLGTDRRRDEGTIQKSVYILRPCMIHGPGNKGNLNLLFSVVSRGISWPLGAFENKRSFTSIGNLVFVLEKLVEGIVEPGIYQVADDEPVSTNEIIEMIARSQGKKARIWNFPKSWIRALASVGDFLHLPLNSERLKKLTESYVVSNAKLKTSLGISRMPVEAKEGLQRTFESF